jgi:hypothetical protein
VSGEFQRSFLCLANFSDLFCVWRISAIFFVSGEFQPYFPPFCVSAEDSAFMAREAALIDGQMKSQSRPGLPDMS